MEKIEITKKKIFQSCSKTCVKSFFQQTKNKKLEKKSLIFIGHQWFNFSQKTKAREKFPRKSLEHAWFFTPAVCRSNWPVLLLKTTANAFTSWDKFDTCLLVLVPVYDLGGMSNSLKQQKGNFEQKLAHCFSGG